MKQVYNIGELTPKHFYHRAGGSLRAGVRWRTRTALGLETHSTYQYTTVPEVQALVADLKSDAEMRQISVVTDTGYTHEKVVYFWRAA